MKFRCRVVLSVVSALVGACGDNLPAAPDAAEPPDGPPPFVAATPSSMPQLVNLGGTTLAHPKLQAIFFANDATVQAQIEAFEAQLATSSYWTVTTGEYGVAGLEVLPTLVATDAAPTTEGALTAWLASQLDGSHAGWSYDPEAIYSVFLPDGVVLSSPDGSRSCVDYGAYHDEITGGQGEAIVYALMPRCHAPGSVLDALTESASHEWIEAATDPRVETAPAFGDADADHYIWAYLPGAETGDYCEYLDSAYQPLVGTFMVQRTWSNAAARAGHDPCVPALAGPYVAAAPVLVDDAPIDGFTGPVTTKSVQVPVGASRTIDVQLYSDAPTPDFTVRAFDLASAYFGGATELTFQWDRQTGHNGDTLHLTITRVRAGDATGSEFAIVTERDGEPTTLWWSLATK